MSAITLHYNPSCSACSQQARRTARLDWLGRIALSTANSPLGDVPKGQIVVVDARSRRVFTGIYATRKICLQVPFFLLYGLALFLLPIKRLAGGQDLRMQWGRLRGLRPSR